jgi:hypothetical protein
VLRPIASGSAAQLVTGVTNGRRPGGPGPIGPDRPPSGVYCPESADFRLYTAGENAYDPPAADAAM